VNKIMPKKAGEWVARDSKTGRFLVETFRSDATEAASELARQRGSAGRADYGRLLKQDVERYGTYIREKRLNRQGPGRG
jgi:hypothetical protein